MFRATVRAATVINRISHFWSVKIGQGKLQILVINGVTSLGSGPHIPTRFFKEISSGPCQSLFIFVFQPILFYIIAAERHYMLLPTLKTDEY